MMIRTSNRTATHQGIDISLLRVVEKGVLVRPGKNPGWDPSAGG
jgi:hypothetical protein